MCRFRHLWEWWGHLNNAQALWSVLVSAATAALGFVGFQAAPVDVLRVLSVVIAALGVSALVFIAYVTTAARIGWLPPTERNIHHVPLPDSKVGSLGALDAKLIPSPTKALALRVTKAFDFDEHGTIPDGTQIRVRRTAMLAVETTDGDVDHVRLNLLRFTPQGRSGAIFLRERHDLPPYTQSSVSGYKVQRGAPVVFDLCSWVNPDLQGAEKLIALHYATPPGMEPNGIRPICPYFFEVQAIGENASSDPATFSAEIDAGGDLISRPAIWPD